MTVQLLEYHLYPSQHLLIHVEDRYSQTFVSFRVSTLQLSICGMSITTPIKIALAMTICSVRRPISANQENDMSEEARKRCETLTKSSVCLPFMDTPRQTTGNSVTTLWLREMS